MNYAFTAVWVAEGLWWRFAPAHYGRRSPMITTAVRCTFLFMIINGAVLFVDGPRRLLGIGVLGTLIWIWRIGRHGRA